MVNLPSTQHVQERRRPRTGESAAVFCDWPQSRGSPMSLERFPVRSAILHTGEPILQIRGENFSHSHWIPLQMSQDSNLKPADLEAAALPLELLTYGGRNVPLTDGYGLRLPSTLSGEKIRPGCHPAYHASFDHGSGGSVRPFGTSGRTAPNCTRRQWSRSIAGGDE